MKTALTLLCLSMALASTMKASDWRQRLMDLNPGVIDSVPMITTDEYNADLCHSYMIYYHQPLQHDAPELGNLPLRALLTVRNDEDFTQLMTQVYIGGYALDSVWVEYPNWAFAEIAKTYRAELADRYNGNVLVPEHRYFGESCPENPWESLGYCEAKEAAADFHALIEAMKKVFSGKWAITGLSKGGETTAMQHAFYPDDADCFVPYSGPYLGYYQDQRMQEYYMTHSWNRVLNEKMLHLQRLMTSSEELFDLYCQSSGIDPVAGIDDPITVCYFADGVGNLDFSPRCYYSREEVEQIFASNEDVLQQNELDDYTPEMMLYMLLNVTIQIDQDYFDWYEQNFTTEAAANGPSRTHSRLKEGVKLEHKRKPNLPVFSVDEENWKRDAMLASWYQCMHELGYYDVRFDYYYDDPEEARRVNEMWQSLYNNALEPYNHHLFDDVEYNPELSAFVHQQTAQTQKPILFLYGGDDPWAGAHMEDEYVNGDNVQLFILPEQNHEVTINAVTDLNLQNEIWAFTDAIFDTTVGISTLHDNAPTPARYYDLYGRRLSQGQRGVFMIKK